MIEEFVITHYNKESSCTGQCNIQTLRGFCKSWIVVGNDSLSSLILITSHCGNNHNVSLHTLEFIDSVQFQSHSIVPCKGLYFIEIFNLLSIETYNTNLLFYISTFSASNIVVPILHVFFKTFRMLEILKNPFHCFHLFLII